jgi:tRNA A-37 threonylcarbamoyl transferase component Bud32/tetratricopeptide (TPR) repeat protein
VTRDGGEPFDALLRAVAASPNVPLPGTTLLCERFRLQRRLGAGAFGVVYEADDLRDRGRVALKMLRHPEADWLYRFKREFRALQGLAHPGLVTLHELFCDNGQWFFTMELIEGQSFVDYVRGLSALPEPDVVSTTRAIHPAPPSSPATRTAQEVRPAFHEARLREGLQLLFEGLSVLHSAARVHRDVKPSNVLVTREGRVVLIDFGLVTESMNATLSAAAAGTPAYMAPEQAASKLVGPAADLYAVGVMLYEILTGRLPIDGPALQLLIDKQTRAPLPPRTVTSGLPRDLDELCVRLLHIDPSERSRAAELWRSTGTSRRPDPVAERATEDGQPFVGRRTELAQLRAAFDASSTGRLAMVLVSGSSGIGKSRLLQRFAVELTADDSGAILLEGRCHEREAIPYKTIDGVVDALSRFLSRRPAGEVAALLPTHRTMLARLFPVMLRVPQLAKESAKTESIAEPQQIRERAFSALRELFTRVAMDRPTVLVVDDLQWADEDGLRALAEVLRSPDAPPLLFVGAIRGGSDDVAMKRLLAALPGEVTVIDLTSLDPEEACDLAAKLLAPTGSSAVDPATIAIEAGGHPLFVEELAHRVARMGSADGHLRLDDVIGSRVAQLDEAARNVAEILAVAGKPLSQQIAAAAARLEPASFQSTAAVLRTANLVRTSGARWGDSMEPYHDRVREAVVARMDPERRRVLHEALATAFEASAPVDAEALAVHWREAGNAPRAADYAERAGHQASRTFAFDRARSWFEQALELLSHDHPRRRELHIQLAEALALAGRGALAAPHFEAAAADSPVVEAIELRRRAAEQLLRSGHFDRGMETCRVVLAAIGMRMPATRLETLVSFVYYDILLRLRGIRFRQRDYRQVTREERTRADICWSLGIALSFVESFVGFVFLRRALLLAMAVGDLDRIVRALAMIAGSSGVVGARRGRTERLVRQTRQLAERSGSIEARAYGSIAISAARYFSGHFREAEAQLAGTLQILEDRSAGLIHERVTIRLYSIWSLSHLGRFRELRRQHGEALRDARARGDVYAAVNLTIGISNVAWLVDDRPGVAESEVLAAMEQWSKRGFHLEHYFALTARVWSRVYAGDVETAHSLADELLRLTKPSLLWRLRNVRFRALYAHGACALAMLEHRLGDRQKLLGQAAACARALERVDLDWIRPFAMVLRAGVAFHMGAYDEACARLDGAAREFTAGDLVAYAAATSDRAARMRADASSAAEIARVATFLRSEDVVAPDRMIAMLVPGLLARTA